MWPGLSPTKISLPARLMAVRSAGSVWLNCPKTSRVAKGHLGTCLTRAAHNRPVHSKCMPAVRVLSLLADSPISARSAHHSGWTPRFPLPRLTWVPQFSVRLVTRIWLLTCINVPDPGTSLVYLGTLIRAGQRPGRCRLVTCANESCLLYTSD